jgi:hypothetical protein
MLMSSSLDDLRFVAKELNEFGHNGRRITLQDAS